jgi:SPP1 family predicted phage head-tail adaptor
MQPFKYKPKVNSGDLRHLIDIYGKVKYSNELNETAFEFRKLKTVCAAIIPQTGSLQKQQTDTVLTNVTHKIIVRYDSENDIKNDMYIMFNNHRFDIKYTLNPYFKNECLEIFCQEVIE